MLYDGRRFVSIASLGPEIKERTVVINGVSKSFSMTGWRIGYAAASPEIISAMSRIQSHSTSNATSISQWAALEALESAGADVQRMVADFAQRRDAMHELVERLPGVTCSKPAGAFYLFPDVSSLFGSRAGERTIETAQDFAIYLLDTAAVAVVPGEGFGAPEHVRLSYAASLDRIREGMARIEQAVADLQTS
jgi:aspartate aminotransferase